MKLISLLIFAFSAFAGQSVQYGVGLLQSTSVPNTPTNRVEFYIHDWSPTGTTHIVGGNATGWLIYTQVASPTNVSLIVYNEWETAGGQLAQIQIGNLPQRAVYVRAQHDPVKKLDLIEAWDINGVRIANNSFSYTAELDSGTTFLMGYGNEPSMFVGFMRVHSGLVPPNSRPPVTSDDNNRVFEWKFDGSLADASGNGHPLTYFGGTPVYSPTPYQNTVAAIKTSDANSWASVVTQRAGYPVTLDGSSSYSQSDLSAAVACFWQQLSGPSQAQFSSRSSCRPTITGLVFGDYRMQLTVTDAAGNRVTTADDIGVVAMDSKGVVVNADPRVDALFGNMIAYGKNPWGFADYWANHAMTLRSAVYDSSGWSALQWEKTGSGTTSYYWNGVGYYPGNPNLGTTLTAPLTPTSTTLSVADVSKLDFSELPTRILMVTGNYPTANEEIRICAVSGNTLTVCYDGRGQNPLSWNTGAGVGQVKVTGHGTHFLTDAVAPVCPVGAPAPPGPATFTGGSVNLTAGSATITGVGTNWASTTGEPTPAVDDFVRVAATHAGIPFQFVARNMTGGAVAGASTAGGSIAAVNILFGQTGRNYTQDGVTVVIADPTGSGATVTANVVAGAITSYTINSAGTNYTNPTVLIQPTVLTLRRPYPSDADSGTFPGYAILPAHRTIVLRGRHAVDPAGLGESMWGTTGCESETSVYVSPLSQGNSFSLGHDSTLLDGSFQDGYPYSVTDSDGWVNQSSTGGISFYGESLGSRALYYRSGLTAAKKAADIIDDNLIKSPWGNRDVSGAPTLWVGGAAIGAFTSGILTGRVPWADLRSYAANGEFTINGVYNNNAPNCEFDDTRDTGYAYAWVILGSIYDPDTSPGGFRSRWQGDLAKMRINDSACKRADASWANGFYWNKGFGPVTLTTGSTAVVGTGLPMSACTGTATGTASVTSGSATVTVIAGSFPSTGANTLVITGTLGGNSFTGSYLYSGSGSTVTLSVLWPGDSGNVTWMSVSIPNLSTDAGAMTSFATDTSDYTDLQNNYACIWNSDSSLTLDHPWRGATLSSYYGYLGNLAGFGQQPFMLGIKTYGMGLLSRATDPALAAYSSAYSTYNQVATQWIHDKGLDATTLTTNYGRVFPFCEPTTTASGPSIDFRTPGCNYGNSIGGRAIGREQNQELGNAVADFFQYNPSAANRTWGDSVYGAVWGNPAYNTGGVYSDEASDASNIGLTNLLDTYINAGKWYGFFAGMGMLHRWPAVRLGGVDPPVNRTVYVPFTLAGTAHATQARLTITLASGATATQVCTASPCPAVVDRRSGSVLMKLDYLNALGAVVAPGDNLPLYVPK